VDDGRVFTHCTPDPQPAGGRFVSNYIYPSPHVERVGTSLNLIFTLSLSLSKFPNLSIFLSLNSLLFFFNSNHNYKNHTCYDYENSTIGIKSHGLILGPWIFGFSLVSLWFHFGSKCIIGKSRFGLCLWYNLIKECTFVL
jgi:hypothetical protein